VLISLNRLTYLFSKAKHPNNQQAIVANNNNPFQKFKVKINLQTLVLIRLGGKVLYLCSSSILIAARKTKRDSHHLNIRSDRIQ
jgi:hypothetical protein